MLKTYSLPGAVNFILYLLEKQQEDVIWEVWLHRKPAKGDGKRKKYLNFDEFKKQVKLKKMRTKKAKSVTAAEEKQQLEFASRFIKTKEADSGGSI